MAVAAAALAARRKNANSRRASDRAGNSDSVAARDQRPDTGSGGVTRPRAAPFGGGIWGVIVIAGIIAILSIVEYGTVKEGTFLALLVFLVLGSLAPVVAIVLGVIIIFAIMIRGAGVKLFSWLGKLPNQTQPTQSSLPNPVGVISGYTSNGQPISA